jgi:hypothetical protein
MHAVIRRYRVRLGTVEQAVRFADKQFVPLMRRIPGFVACYLMDAGNDILATIGLFETSEGAEGAVRLQRDWFRDEWSSFRPLPPEVVAGEVLARAVVSERPLMDRRRLSERRLAAILVAAERRNGSERRAGIERRAEVVSHPDWNSGAALQAAG